MIKGYLSIYLLPFMVENVLPSEEGKISTGEQLNNLIGRLLFGQGMHSQLRGWVNELFRTLPEPEVLTVYMARQTVSKEDPNLVFYDSKPLSKLLINTIKILGLARQMDEDLTIDVRACEFHSMGVKTRTTVGFANKVPVYVQACDAHSPSWYNTNQIVYRTLEQVSQLNQSYNSIKFRADYSFYNVRIMGFLRKYKVNYYIEASSKFYRHKIQSIKNWTIVANDPFTMEIGSFTWTTQGWNHRFLIARWRLDDSLDHNVFGICTNDLSSTDKEVLQNYIGKDVVVPLLEEMRTELWEVMKFSSLSETTIFQTLGTLVYLIHLGFRNLLVEEGIDGITYESTIEDLRNAVFESIDRLNDNNQLMMP